VLAGKVRLNVTKRVHKLTSDQLLWREKKGQHSERAGCNEELLKIAAWPIVGMLFLSSSGVNLLSLLIIVNRYFYPVTFFNCNGSVEVTSYCDFHGTKSVLVTTLSSYLMSGMVEKIN
jgi:hypothetical protein